MSDDEEQRSIATARAKTASSSENNNRPDSDSDEDEALNDDGTRVRNLTLWEAAAWRSKIYAVFESGSFPSDVPSTVERFTLIFSLSMIAVIITSSVSVML